jgi:NAD(P)-dependent dehydrogenase (short-subunit alcohol dehydrogenase family)
VTQIESLKASIDHACDIFGRIDALVNNAANDERHCFSGLSLVDWNANLAVNLTSAFVASQKVAPIMAQAGGGVIINFSSINALFGPENLVAYNTAKAGIIGLTKSLATELGNSRIRVNTVIPGWVATEKQLNTWLTPELEKLWTDNMCLKQRISPSEVAKLVLFLVSDDASMITSQKFILDGGWY